jgi:hypothetical protein
VGGFEVKVDRLPFQERELQGMLSNKDRNNKGNVRGVDEGHTKRKTEPGARELRRKNMVKNVKRRK